MFNNYNGMFNVMWEIFITYFYFYYAYGIIFWIACLVSPALAIDYATFAAAMNEVTAGLDVAMEWLLN